MTLIRQTAPKTVKETVRAAAKAVEKVKGTKDMPWVLFPHRQHSEWLACSNCHPRPFAESAGANEMDMDSIMRGEHCGLCHDRVSFSIFRCERCHSLPHGDSPPPWW